MSIQYFIQDNPTGMLHHNIIKLKIEIEPYFVR